jgi:hypothetical protein
MSDINIISVEPRVNVGLTQPIAVTLNDTLYNIALAAYEAWPDHATGYGTDWKCWIPGYDDQGYIPVTVSCNADGPVSSFIVYPPTAPADWDWGYQGTGWPPSTTVTFVQSVYVPGTELAFGVEFTFSTAGPTQVQCKASQILVSAH